MKTYQKVIIAVVICAIGSGAVLWLVRGKKAPEAPLHEPTPVEAVKAKAGSILRRVSTVGNLAAIQSVVLIPEVRGKIAKIYFEEGQNVKKGDPLFKIEDAIYRAKVKLAEGELAFRKEEYSRAIKLLEKNFGTLAMRDKTLSEMQVAEANLDEAKINLDNTVIKAPFDGVMGLTEYSVGSYVTESTELAPIVDLNPIYVDFSIPEAYLPYVHEGDIIDVTIEDFDILPVEATIKAIAPEIEPTTRTVTIRAEMPNKDLAYRPNEFARVLVLAGKIEGAVLIPEASIEREGEEEYVFLVVDNVAVKTTVSSGMRDGDEVEVTHGVKDGDLVVSAGQFNIHDGEEVTVVTQGKEK
jgi:membrane fusion protein, multidrug efflux system